jgi:hypothetical protein
MDSFYTIVVLVAVVFLIICLIIVGIMMQYQKGEDAFPPKANTCPDKWTVGATGSCAHGGNNGSMTTATAWCENNPAVCTVSGSQYTFLEGASVCDKQNFAKANDILWDGVSNYNKCV